VISKPDGRAGQAVKNHPVEHCRYTVRHSDDEGETWGDPVLAIPEPGYCVVNNERLLQTREGRLLIPAAKSIDARYHCVSTWASSCASCLPQPGRLERQAGAKKGRSMTAGTDPFFTVRGVVLTPSDVTTWGWPRAAQAAGLNTIALHGPPGGIVDFLGTGQGAAYLETCAALGLQVEYELHAAHDLLPRDLFARDPAMFRMDERGDRVPDWNLCVHSQPALDVARERAAAYAGALRPTTGRYFFWIDDGQPMCRCPQCRGLSDSDQALILENALLDALRQVDPRATLAHLAYLNTLPAPSEIRPQPGIFVEYAPIRRRHDTPFGQRDAVQDRPDAPTHGEQLDDLDANLAWFGAEDAQALEYWLDVSRFSGWKREKIVELPWHSQILADDLCTYAARGIRRVTSFAVWIDGQYVRRFGEPPVQEYGAALLGFAPGHRQPTTDLE
jgi:hypothetical protein